MKIAQPNQYKPLYIRRR